MSVVVAELMQHFILDQKFKSKEQKKNMSYKNEIAKLKTTEME
jgi:hypothetical protein